MTRPRLIVAAAVLAVLFGTSVAAAPITFDGDYDPANWIFDADGGNGSVDTSGAPSSITLFGHDDDDEELFDVVTTFSITAPAGITLDFFWFFVTLDGDGPSFDPAGYFVNDSFFQLSNDDGPDIQSGFVSGVVLNSGDVFGFYVDSTDGCCGGGSITISGTEIPEPSTWALFGLGLGALGLTRRLRSQAG